MNRIIEIFRDSKTPLIVVKKAGEVASAEATLQAFSDGDDGYAIVSNSTELHSPTTGKKLETVEGVQQNALTEDFAELSEMVVDGETAYSLLMDPDLAFDLAGETIYSPVDGKEVVLQYKESDETASDDEGIVPVAVDGNEEETAGDDIEEDLDSGIEEVDGDDEIDLDVDAEVDSELEGDDEGNEGDEGDDSEEPEEAPESFEDSEEASEEENVADATLVLEAEHNVDQPLRLVQMDVHGSEVAAFSGKEYIGSLHRAKAATNLQSMFDNGAKLYNSFKAVINNNASNLRAAEVANFGFEPAVHRVEVASIIAQVVEEAKAEATAEVASSLGNQQDRFKKVLSLALLGISKGYYDVPNALITETASVLTNAGVRNAEFVVRRALVAASEEFASAVVDQANELMGQSDDFLKGVASGISKADYKGAIDPASVTTIYATPEAPAPAGETAGYSNTRTRTQGNRYANLVTGLGRRSQR